MTKLSLSISRALLLGALLILPIAVSAQAPAVDEKQAAAEREWYAACNPETDKQKCYDLSKSLIANFPSTTYKKYAQAKIDAKEINDLWVPFKAAVDAFYAAQDGPKLDNLYRTGDAFLQRSPGYSWAIAQQGLAGNGLVLQETYKDRAKVKGYIQKAMDHFAAANTSDAKAMDQNQWANFRDNIMSTGYEVNAYDAIESKGDPAVALGFIDKGIKVRSTVAPNLGWKNPNFYFLRAQLTNDQYTKLGEQYKALTDEEKVGDKGKELLKQIGTVIDKLIADYARAMAAAATPEMQPYKDEAKKRFDSLWGYRTGAPEKAAAYLQSYVADPTIPDTEVPAKPAETAMAPPTNMPASGGSGVKVAAGQQPGAKTPVKAAKPAAKSNKKKR